MPDHVGIVNKWGGIFIDARIVVIRIREAINCVTRLLTAHTERITREFFIFISTIAWRASEIFN